MTTYNDTHTHASATADGVTTETTTYLRTYCDTDVHVHMTTGGVVYEVGTGVALIDGRVAPFDTIQPGDTIALLAGSHSAKNIKNIQGEAGNPIIITNSGGLVEFNSADYSDGAMFMRNCQHVHITGSGDVGTEYGIKLTKYYSKGIYGTCKTSDIEIDHVKIMESVVTGIGIHFLNYGLPAEYANAHNWDAYDYDGDTVLEGLDGRVWTCENLKVHNCHFDGTAATWNLDVPIYIGMSNYTETPHTRTLEDAGGTPVPGVTVYYPPTDVVEVYDCIFEHTEMKCVQVGSCLTSLKIHDNVFTDVCHQVAAHDPTIGVNPGSSGVEIYNNRIIDMNNGYGIYSYGEEVSIYNNVIINPGYYGMIVEDIKPVGYHHYKNTWVFNNTIVSTYNAWCIGYTNGEGDDERIQNNILINTNARYTSYPAGDFTVGNNYENTNVDNALFTDHDNHDYTLQAGSPCLNAGTDLTAYGVTDDIIGTARPQGAAYDQGAYERV